MRPAAPRRPGGSRRAESPRTRFAALGASGTVRDFGSELELAEAEILVAGHRGVGVLAGEAVWKYDLLVCRKRFAATFEIEADRFRFAGRVQTKATAEGHALARNIVRFRRPQTAYVAVGRREMARYVRAVRPAARKVRCRSPCARGRRRGARGAQGDGQTRDARSDNQPHRGAGPTNRRGRQTFLHRSHCRTRARLPAPTLSAGRARMIRRRTR